MHGSTCKTWRLQHCPILALECPSCAQVDLAWAPVVCSHTELVRLDLSGAPSLSDAAVHHIGKLPCLSALNLSSCSALSDSALSHLSNVGTLQLLKLEALPKVSHAGVAHLERLSALRWLSLAGCTGLRAAGFVTSIAKLSKLRHLNLNKVSSVDDDGVACIVGKLCELRALKLGWCFRISSRALGSLCELRHLTALDVAHTKLDDSSLTTLAGSLTRMRELNLRGCAISDAGLARCRGFGRLEVLSLRTCEVGDGCVEGLLEMPRLRELDGVHRLSDGGLAAPQPPAG